MDREASSQWLGADSAQLGTSGQRWLDFSTCVNPFGPPRSVREAIARAAADTSTDALLHRYPDPYARHAKTALAQYLGIDEQCLLLTNGSNEAIRLTVNLLEPKRIHIVEPCYSEYAKAAVAVGVELVRHKAPSETDFRWTAAPIIRQLGEGDCLIAAQPNNPTGYLLARDEFIEIWENRPRRRGRLLIDEALIDFVSESERHSFRELACKRDDVVVAGSLSYLFALPGLRIGYLIASPTLIRLAARLQPTWSVNALAQMAVEVALHDVAYLHRTKEWLPRARRVMMQMLHSLPGIRPIPSVANFILVDVQGTGGTAAAWQTLLANRAISVRTGDSFEGLGEYFLRLAVRLPEENERLVAVMRSFL